MIAGVILAAGQSRRMGQPKQLLLLDEKPLVWHVASAACQAELAEVVVVVGAHAASVRQALTGLPLKVVFNEFWAHGQSASVIAAVKALALSLEAVVFLLADQPQVDAALINLLVKAYRETGASIVAPAWQGRRGNPVLFDLPTWRNAFLELTGDEGARGIIIKHSDLIKYVEVADDKVLLDVDTPADYFAVKEQWLKNKKNPGRA